MGVSFSKLMTVVAVRMEVIAVLLQADDGERNSDADSNDSMTVGFDAEDATENNLENESDDMQAVSDRLVDNGEKIAITENVENSVFSFTECQQESKLPVADQTFNIAENQGEGTITGDLDNDNLHERFGVWNRWTRSSDFGLRLWLRELPVYWGLGCSSGRMSPTMTESSCPPIALPKKCAGHDDFWFPERDGYDLESSIAFGVSSHINGPSNACHFKKIPNHAEPTSLGDGVNELFTACRIGDSGVVTRLLENASTEIDVNILFDTGYDRWKFERDTARAQNRKQIVQALSSRYGIAPDHVLGMASFTPLILASYHGNTGVVQALLACRRIEINKANKLGHTAMHVACDHGQLDIIRLLLRQEEFDINEKRERTTYHSTGSIEPVLWYVVHEFENRRTEVLRLLLDHPKTDVNIQSSSSWGGTTALMASCQCAKPDIVRMLLEHPDIKLDITDEENKTALMIASKNQNYYYYPDKKQGAKECLQLLMDHPDTDVNTTDVYGRTTLMERCKCANPDVVRYFTDSEQQAKKACLQLLKDHIAKSKTKETKKEEKTTSNTEEKNQTHKEEKEFWTAISLGSDVIRRKALHSLGPSTSSKRVSMGVSFSKLMAVVAVRMEVIAVLLHADDGQENQNSDADSNDSMTVGFDAEDAIENNLVDEADDTQEVTDGLVDNVEKLTVADQIFDIAENQGEGTSTGDLDDNNGLQAGRRSSDLDLGAWLRELKAYGFELRIPRLRAVAGESHQQQPRLATSGTASRDITQGFRLCDFKMRAFRFKVPERDGYDLQSSIGFGISSQIDGPSNSCHFKKIQKEPTSSGDGVNELFTSCRTGDTGVATRLLENTSAEIDVNNLFDTGYHPIMDGRGQGRQPIRNREQTQAALSSRYGIASDDLYFMTNFTPLMLAYEKTYNFILTIFINDE
eukprot:gene434-445_t